MEEGRRRTDGGMTTERRWVKVIGGGSEATPALLSVGGGGAE